MYTFNLNSSSYMMYTHTREHTHTYTHLERALTSARITCSHRGHTTCHIT